MCLCIGHTDLFRSFVAISKKTTTAISSLHTKRDSCNKYNHHRVRAVKQVPHV